MINYEILLASSIGVMVAAGVYLMLRARTFPVVLGLAMLGYAVNLFLFSMGRVEIGAPPIIQDGVTNYVDPLPQALVLTAIVIGFGMTAFAITLAVKGFVVAGDDHMDAGVDDGHMDAGVAEDDHMDAGIDDDGHLDGRAEAKRAEGSDPTGAGVTKTTREEGRR